MARSINWVLFTFYNKDKSINFFYILGIMLLSIPFAFPVNDKVEENIENDAEIIQENQIKQSIRIWFVLDVTILIIFLFVNLIFLIISSTMISFESSLAILLYLQIIIPVALLLEYFITKPLKILVNSFKLEKN